MGFVATTEASLPVRHKEMGDASASRGALWEGHAVEKAEPPAKRAKLSRELLHQYSETFRADRTACMARNVVTRVGTAEAAIDRTVADRVSHLYTDTLKGEGSVTDQKSSGRCWMFAGLNAMRMGMKEKYKLSEFEFSQTYLFFFDKLEKANVFLNQIMDTAALPLSDRLVKELLTSPISDGGFWGFFENLVQKYGVVPKSVMPERFSSEKSGPMNELLKSKLREYAQELREKIQKGASTEELRASKEKMMGEIYRMLAIHLGQPPESFDWQYKDKEGHVHVVEGLTPQRFVEEYVPYDVQSKIVLVNAPTKDKPFGHTYTFDYVENVEECPSEIFLNLPIEELRYYTDQMIREKKEAVWFGCDVGKEAHFSLGVLDPSLYDYDSLLGVPKCAMSKGDRLEYRQATMSHAMLMTGVDLRGDKESGESYVKWRVENSWGSDSGEKGFLAMTDEWFGEHVFEVVIDRSLLKPEHLRMLEQEPIRLPPWDPVNSFSR